LARQMAHQGVEVTLVPGRARRGRMIRFRQQWRDVFRDPAVGMDDDSYSSELLATAGLPFTKELTRAAQRAFDDLRMAYYGRAVRGAGRRACRGSDVMPGRGSRPPAWRGRTLHPRSVPTANQAGDVGNSGGVQEGLTDGRRVGGHRVAKQVLSQLSYGPVTTTNPAMCCDFRIPRADCAAGDRYGFSHGLSLTARTLLVSLTTPPPNVLGVFAGGHTKRA
jgi:hypothetical protein